MFKGLFTGFMLCILCICSIAQEKTNIPKKEVVNNTDPVCHMRMHKGDIEDTTLYNGQVIGFCTHHCKQMFANDPTKYPLSKKIDQPKKLIK